jgi:uncharacterized protein YdaU (DUF1376 family)
MTKKRTTAQDAPWFPFWTKEWLTDERVLAVSPEVRGALITLRAWAWLSTPPCTLPADELQLARLSGLGRRWRRLRETVLQFFIMRENRWVDPMLQVLHDEMVTAHAKRSAASRTAATARWSAQAPLP